MALETVDADPNPGEGQYYQWHERTAVGHNQLVAALNAAADGDLLGADANSDLQAIAAGNFEPSGAVEDHRNGETHTTAQPPQSHADTEHSVAYEQQANKGSASGYAGLDANAEVPFAQLPFASDTYGLRHVEDVAIHGAAGGGELSAALASARDALPAGGGVILVGEPVDYTLTVSAVSGEYGRAFDINRDNVHVVIAHGATVQVRLDPNASIGTNARGQYGAFYCANQQNVSIVSYGELIGDRANHDSSDPARGHTIAFGGVENCRVECWGPTHSAWGDNINIASVYAGEDAAGNDRDKGCLDGFVYAKDCYNANRNNLAVTGLIRGEVNGVYRDATGTSLNCGVDLEPNSGNEVSSVKFPTLLCYGNDAQGFRIGGDGVIDGCTYGDIRCFLNGEQGFEHRGDTNAMLQGPIFAEANGQNGDNTAANIAINTSSDGVTISGMLRARVGSTGIRPSHGITVDGSGSDHVLGLVDPGTGYPNAALYVSSLGGLDPVDTGGFIRAGLGVKADYRGWVSTGTYTTAALPAAGDLPDGTVVADSDRGTLLLALAGVYIPLSPSTRQIEVGSSGLFAGNGAAAENQTGAAVVSLPDSGSPFVSTGHFQVPDGWAARRFDVLFAPATDGTGRTARFDARPYQSAVASQAVGEVVDASGADNVTVSVPDTAEELAQFSISTARAVTPGEFMRAFIQRDTAHTDDDPGALYIYQVAIAEDS